MSVKNCEFFCGKTPRIGSNRLDWDGAKRVESWVELTLLRKAYGGQARLRQWASTRQVGLIPGLNWVRFECQKAQGFLYFIGRQCIMSFQDGFVW